MKITNSVLKVAALVLSAAALVCLVIANLELISDALNELWETLQEKKGRFRLRRADDDYSISWDDDEFEDWGGFEE